VFKIGPPASSILRLRNKVLGIEGAVRTSQWLHIPNTKHEKEESIHALDHGQENTSKPRVSGTTIAKMSKPHVSAKAVKATKGQRKGYFISNSDALWARTRMHAQK
jgi:hypothetical protein